jgi:hypothetical protein
MSLDSDECRTALLYSFPLNQALLSSPTPAQTAPKAPKAPIAATAMPAAPKPSESVINPNKYQLLENVDYGAVSTNLPEHGQEKYYLSTAIAYTNGYPHIGHAYEVDSPSPILTSMSLCLSLSLSCSSFLSVLSPY